MGDAARARRLELDAGAVHRAELAGELGGLELEREALEWCGELGRHFDMEEP